MDISSDFCNAVKSCIIQTEVNVLHALGYEVERLNNTPHKFMLFFLKTLKVDREVAQVAWNVANDCYLTTAPLHYPPELLATSCIYLAYRLTQVPIPKVAWWLLSEYSLELVEQAAACTYRAYQIGSPNLEKACSIVSSFGKKTSSSLAFSLSFSPMYKVTDEGLVGGGRSKGSTVNPEIEKKLMKRSGSKQRSRHHSKDRDSTQDYQKSPLAKKSK
jgi:hypothetical protein